ncbi:MAG: hypothetical protein ABR607_02220 [Pyrinomonadaceae bacterium]
MKIYGVSLVLLLLVAPALAQTPVVAKSSGAGAGTTTIPAPPAITDKSTPVELARAALAALGGDKFKNLKSTTMIGSANLYAPNQSQSIPGSFAIVTVGDKLRIDINAQPIFTFKQVYDGQRSFSNMPGVEIPPPSKFGLSVLGKFDRDGYTVSALPDKKKLRGFRIADSEGRATDFYIDSATARVSEFIIPYNGMTLGSSISKYREVDGVLIPVSFSQRFEMPAGAYFAEYKVKDVKINSPIGDDMFVIQ